MIKIINGTYGRKVGNRIVPTTYKDGPFELSTEKEERLVSRGVAEYVKSNKGEVYSSDTSGSKSSEAITNDSTPDDKRETLRALTRKELDKIAKDLEIDKPDKMAKKDEVIEAILSVDDEVVEDGEEPPKFGEEDLV